jgi:hypothetical protein
LDLPCAAIYPIIHRPISLSNPSTDQKLLPPPRPESQRLHNHVDIQHQHHPQILPIHETDHSTGTIIFGVIASVLALMAIIIGILQLRKTNARPQADGEA